MSDAANIAAVLPAMAERRPFQPAIMFPDGRDENGRVRYTHFTYRQLDEESDRIARGLEAVGIGRGVRTVLMVRPSLEFFALAFAMFKAGTVPVLVDPGIGRRNLGICLEEAEPEAFIGIPAAHAARVLLGWARKTVRTTVTVGRRWFWGGHTLRHVKERGTAHATWTMAETRGDETAAILFTSGSTGVPKGVVYRHEHFLAQVEKIRTHFGIQPGEIDLPTFPLFALFDPALGMTTVVPDMDPTRPAHVDPRKIIEAIEDFGVTNMFGSPALLRTVGRYGAANQVKLPTLARVISSGAPVSAAVMEPFAAMLAPEASIHPSYGATESMPVASFTSQEVLGDTGARAAEGAGVCVGRPVAGIEIRIIRISDDAIPEWRDDLLLDGGEVGEITVRGSVVTREYFRRPESTALAKIHDGGSVWHRMGDLGYLDEQGRLWFCGRKAHRVVLATGETLFSVPCEGVFNHHPAVFRTALVGVNLANRTVPAICVELEKEQGGADRALLTRELRDLGARVPQTAGIERFLIHPGFPVDPRHNAKIDREQLAAWAQEKLR
jgi:acyl-CoA synthetase (AMP-forming)/AMP-acid ligase II